MTGRYMLAGGKNRNEVLQRCTNFSFGELDHACKTDVQEELARSKFQRLVRLLSVV